MSNEKKSNNAETAGIVILGNGIAGITCARYVRKNDGRAGITVVSDEAPHFFSRTALMYVYMGHLRRQDIKPYADDFWPKNRIALRSGRVERIDFPAKTLYFTGGETLRYDRLVLATGSVPNRFDWPGQHLDGVHGLYHLADLDAMERHTRRGIRRAVIVGGGLIGVEMAEMFHSRGIAVTLLVREPGYSSQVLPMDEARLVGRHLAAQGIDVRYNEELAGILAAADAPGGPVAGVRTKSGERIDCEFVGLTAGVRPNVDWLRDSGLEIGKGILVDEHLQTSVPGVYAIGDCAELRSPRPGRRAIEPLWYTGRLMGETLAPTLLGKPTAYDPGLWFNSAKFFDIEYQVYGDIPNELPATHGTLYWEHPRGDRSIRINYRLDTTAVTGFNLFGVRYRQVVCEKWIRSGTTLEHVLENLGLANFDPEFSDEYEGQVVALYNQLHEKNLKLKRRRGLSRVLEFLKK